MKKLTTLLLLLLTTAYCFAQTRIDAKTIIDQVNKGEAVSYQDVEISGDLDFTQLENMKAVHGKNHEDSDHKTYLSRVKSPIRFVNCRFKGGVLAYYSENNKPTCNTDFEEDVTFENCVFEQESAFKYSQFGKNAFFKQCTFTKEALFKYSKFATGPDFSKSTFAEAANFKYTKFPKGVSFEGATFNRDANFKYADFTNGVRFTKASFSGYSDFKYTSFSEPLDLTGVSFSGNEDFKYAKVDGRNFSSYLLRNK